MAKIFSSASGAVYQICTATFSQINDLDIVQDGFPKTIQDARSFFEEVDEQGFWL